MHNTYQFSTLRYLEAEAIYILREVAATAQNPVMLYSVGKDSSVMLHLARKAFYPAKIPFPLLHVDTGFKFPEMYTFRDRVCKELGVELRIEHNEEAFQRGVNPERDGTIKCCALLKTGGLLAALKKGNYDAAFGGARREEEKSRAKERVFSFRDSRGQWDPKAQRPEFWNLYNGTINPGESIRVFPLSNWTELDIWSYIDQEKIEVSELYFAKERLVVERDGQLMPVVGKNPPANATLQMIRYRSLGCHYCTGAIRSSATTLTQIVEEMMTVRTSERGTRIIDHDREGSMEEKKMEGYF